MTMLDRIIETKRAEVAARKATISLADLDRRIAEVSAPRGFRAALEAHRGPALIAEIKKASPSKGLIRADFDPPAHAMAYQAGGAACLSVLTDERWFQGADAYLQAARGAVTLPVLRKDFMVDPWQVHESRSLGADAILIIVAALDDQQMHEIEQTAIDCGMDALVEVHDAHEMARAARLRSRLIGVNNRDLRDFSVDFGRTYDLVGRAPADCTFVAESGLTTRADLDAMTAHGIRCFLVGEALMRADDIEAADAGADRMSELTHIDAAGAARMVDVGGKPDTVREAVATGRIAMSDAAARAIAAGTMKKGDVLAVARIAGIMAAKRTSDLIPLCHPLPLTKVEILLAIDEAGVTATATAATVGPTGVEMEALTAASVALLTVYDMAKAIDRSMRIEGVRLLEKRGGKSGDWTAERA